MIANTGIRENVIQEIIQLAQKNDVEKVILPYEE